MNLTPQFVPFCFQNYHSHGRQTVINPLNVDQCVTVHGGICAYVKSNHYLLTIVHFANRNKLARTCEERQMSILTLRQSFGTTPN